MKKTILFLATMCCMMVSAQQTFTVTFTKEGTTTPVTFSEGTSIIPARNNYGSITINGNNITFDNASVYFCVEGFKIIPSDTKTPYDLNITFRGYNHLHTREATPLLEFMGNPRQINMQGDVLYVECSADAPAIYAHAGSIRTEVMDMNIHNYSENHYTIEMGAGEQMNIVNLESYRRVILYNSKDYNRILAREPKLSSGLNKYSSGSSVTYGTPNSQVLIPIDIDAETRLSEGALPFLSRFVPGLKAGTVSLEQDNGGYYNLTFTDAEIKSGKTFLYGRDVNLRIKVEGKNNIEYDNSWYIRTYNSSNEMRGNIAIEGVGNDAELTITGLQHAGYHIHNQGFISFSNVTAKFIKDNEETVLYNNRDGGDEDYHQLIVRNNAKLMLKHQQGSSTFKLVQGFTNLGTGLNNVFTNPIYGSFINNNFYAEDGETPLHEVYFDSEDYHIVLNESTPVCSLNAEDVMHNGRVRYEDNTLFVNDFDLDNIIADNTLNLTGSNSEIRAIYAPELLIKNSTDFSVNQEILTEKITFEETDFHLNGEINNLDEVPTLIGCHALEYDDFKLEGGVLYGIKGETSEEVESLTIINDSDASVQTSNIAVKAAKTIENGQLLILRDGKRYNAQGVEL